MIYTFDIRRGYLWEQDVQPDNGEALLACHWIDLVDAQDAERDLIQQVLTATLPDSDEVDEIEASARYFTDEEGMHVHSLFLYQSEGRHKTTTVAFILQPQRLLTLRDNEIPDFRLMRMRIRKGRVAALEPEDVLLSVLEQKVENLADQLEDVHRQLEDVSYLVLEDKNAKLDEGIEQLAKLEDSSGKIRLCLMDTQRSISFIQRHLRADTERRAQCVEMHHDIDTLMSHTTFLFDKINFLMDAALGFINIEQNQIIKIFSIAAVVFLPPTLVASLYGMNFRIMPELQWQYGYPMAIALMILAGLAPYVYFKRKGWL
ncbi:MAG: magnesium/cobalt transporter CorA [Gammaproteobacteria bacterium]|nr:magnesium/cobalt transporter CorA [Gammaproteobacteria bacterium]MBQ0775744.1 magnesium/cobalt transporter CorA [Gammaproteobacteria bacterium]